MLVGRALRYSCKECGHTFEKYRNVEEFQASIDCEKCKSLIDSNGVIKRPSKRAKNYNIIGAKVTSAEYNPGLGTVVKNRHHKNELMKQKDVVEVGNDFGSGAKQQDFHEKRKKEELENNWKDPSSFTLE